MARGRLKNVLSEDWKDLKEVWEWYIFQDGLVGDEAARTLDVSFAGLTLNKAQYFGMTTDDLSTLFDEHRQELKRVPMLVLLAATEAALMVDYVVRVRERKKDEISKDFIAIYRLRKLEPKLSEEILDVWRTRVAHPAMKAAIDRYKGALKLRNWLAHGRYKEPEERPKFDPSGIRDYEPEDILEIGTALLTTAGIK